MKALLVLITSTMLASTVSAQVDTLMLLEENRIVTPNPITGTYIHSIDDSNKAIFLCTNNYIYAYDILAYETVWSSPILSNPRNLQFGDINNDDYTDLAFVDDNGIHLFDFIHDSPIWTSPALTEGFEFYKLDDRNGDNYLDMFLVSTDSCFINIDIYDGNEYTNVTSITSTRLYGNGRVEEPTDIYIEHITSNGQIHPFIVLNSSTNQFSEDSGNWSGNIKIFDIDGDLQTSISNIGQTLFNGMINQNDSLYCYGFSYVNYMSAYPSYEKHRYLISRYSLTNVGVDTVLSADFEFGLENRLCFYIDDIEPDRDGLEICFFELNTLDTMKVYSFPDFEYQWSTAKNTPWQSHYYENFWVLPESGLFLFSALVYYYPNNCWIFNSSTGDYAAILPIPAIPIDEIIYDETTGIVKALSSLNNTLTIFNIGLSVDIDQGAMTPNSNHLSQNYPNPFNAATMIKYELPNQALVTLDIYDILGRKIATLTDGLQVAGYHQLVWQAGDMASGVYFYKLTAGDYNETKKMMLIK